MMEKLRAQEVRTVTFGPNDEIINEVRDAYVDHPPEEIANKVLDIVGEVVGQHAARQRANSRNTGRFSWQGVAIDLTVPQLRTLQEAYVVLTELVNKLPRRNPKLIPNTTVEGRPAFAHQKEEHFETKSRWVPFEEESTTRVRSYEENYQVLKHKSQVLEIDYGMDVQHLEKVKELVLDLGTAIQVAIDDANSKGHEPDPAMEGVIESIKRVILASLPPSSSAAPATSPNTSR
ncbi:MAG: hypothetical protein ACLQNE_01555 [Thermoguttaceae bacterium]